MKNYQVITSDSIQAKPVLTITQIQYADSPYLQYDFFDSWGGCAVPVEGGEDFSKCLGRTIKYIKENCEGSRLG